MTMTTIKVSSRTRDRLRDQAKARHRTLGDYLDRLADLADRELRMDALRAARERTSDADLETYKTETSAWQSAELSDGNR